MRHLINVTSLGRHLRTSLFHYLMPGRAHRKAMRSVQFPEPELAILPVLVDPERESIDAGANFGLYTARLAALSSHVHAIEAHPRMQRVLTGVTGRNITIHRRAVSNVSGASVRLAVARNGAQELDGLSRLEEEIAVGPHTFYDVHTMTLNDLAGQDVGFVKIDVEGHELAVLHGAADLIARQQPVFLVEAEQRHRSDAPTDVFSFFDIKGYAGFFLHDGVLKPTSSFLPDMQRTETLVNFPGSVGKTYINNFIFFPPSFDREQLSSLT